MNQHHDPVESWARARRTAEDAVEGPSAATDDAVLAHARMPRRVRMPILRPVAYAAAAVVAALVVGRLVLPDRPTGPDHDFNADGTVDVLDAYALARGLQRGEPPRDADVDGDGTVDQRDVDTMLEAIVRLDTNGGAS